MKVILLKDTAKVGQKNTIAEVANGYAQFLIGQGRAEAATDSKIAQLEKRAGAQEAQVEASKEALQEGLAKIETLVIKANSNEKEHLFEAISAEVIAEQLKKDTGVAVDASAIVIDSPIKELGEHTVEISGEKATIKIEAN